MFDLFEKHTAFTNSTIIAVLLSAVLKILGSHTMTCLHANIYSPALTEQQQTHKQTLTHYINKMLKPTEPNNQK